LNYKTGYLTVDIDTFAFWGDNWPLLFVFMGFARLFYPILWLFTKTKGNVYWGEVRK
jgi:hypothetical protein